MDNTDEIDLLRIISVFWRRKLIIIGVTVPIVVLGVLYASSLQPIYYAQSKVLFEPSGSVVGATSAQTGDALSRIESEIQVARSESILLAIVQDLGLATDDRFNRRERAIDQILDRLLGREVEKRDVIVSIETVRRQVGKMISVRQINRSTLLSFSAETPFPELSAALSNSYAENYISRQVQSKVESALDSLEIINSAIVEAGENLENSQKKLSEYMLQNADVIAYTTGNAGIALLAQDIEATQLALDQLNEDRKRLAALIDQQEYELLAGEFSSADSILSELQVEVFLDLQRRRKNLLAKRESEGPGDDIDAQLALIEADITSLANERLEELANAAALQQERKASLRTNLEVEIFASDLPPERPHPAH